MIPAYRPSLFPKSAPAAGLLAVFALAVLAVIWRFSPFMPSVFYGDDLDYLLLFKDGGCATRASDILTTACYERFRPVASGFVLAMLNLFGDTFQHYLAVNVALHALIATLVFAISQHLTRGNWVASLVLAIVVAASRLAAYQVTQMIGPVESLTLAACLAGIYAAVRADESVDAAWRWGWLAVLMVFLAVHTHERFLVMAVWLGGVFMLSPAVRALGLRRWLALFLACVAVPVYYVAYKTFVLKAHFLVGTGGTHLDPTAASMMEHATQGVRSIFGFNTGPDYLVGATVAPNWQPAYALAALFVLSWASVVLVGLWSAVRAQGAATGTLIDRLRWPFLLLALAVFLLVPSLLTIRLEQRWLMAPFTVVLLVAAWAAGAARPSARLPATAMLAILGFASLALDGTIMRYFDRIFFISSPRFAELVKRDVVDKYPRQSGGVFLLAGADQCSWTLRNGGFFRVYGGKSRNVECFVSIDAAANVMTPGTRVYGYASSRQLADLTDEARISRESAGGPALVDFLHTFSNGRINDPSKVATPTGQGVLVLPWDSVAGTKEAITVISGFSYHFDNVPIENGSEIRFGVGMIYPTAQSARAIVHVTHAGKKTVLFSRDLVPPAEGAKMKFEPVILPLAAYAGQRVSIAFAVESPGGNPSAHWVGFSQPRIVKSPN